VFSFLFSFVFTVMCCEELAPTQRRVDMCLVERLLRQVPITNTPATIAADSADAGTGSVYRLSRNFNIENCQGATQVRLRWHEVCSPLFI